MVSLPQVPFNCSSGCLNVIPLLDDVHNIVPYFVSWQLLKNNTQTLCESFYENGK